MIDIFLTSCNSHEIITHRKRLCEWSLMDMFLSVGVAAGGIQSAVAAVSPGGFPMLIQRPGSIPPEILAAEQQRRASGASQLQHVTAASLATRVCSSVLLYSTTLRLSVLTHC